MKRIFKRIAWILIENRRTTKRYFEIKSLLGTETDEKKRFDLECELENCGVMRVMVCQLCSTYRSDLEYKEKGKEGINCRRCGSNKITYPPQIPKMIAAKLLIRFVTRGF